MAGLTGAMVASIYAKLGGPLVYTPPGGAAVETYGLYRPNAEVVDGETGAVSRVKTMSIPRSAVDVPVRNAALVYTDPEDSTEINLVIDELIESDRHATTVRVR